MNIKQRFLSSTPRFFAILRNLGLTLMLVSTVVMSLHDYGFELPEIVVKLFGWVTASSGLVASIISQLTTIWSNTEVKDGEIFKTE